MKRYGNLTAFQVGVLLILAVPWLSPFAPGPLPTAVPLLVTWWCVALLFAANSKCGAHSDPALLSPYVIASSICFAALVSSVLGIFQYLGWSSDLAPWVSYTGAGEAFANLRQRNQFASLVNMGFICLMWFAKTRRSQPRFCLVVLYVGTAVLGAGNAVSASRTGLLQLALITVVFWRWRAGAQGESAARLVIAVWLAYWLTAWGLPEFTENGGGIFGRAAAIGSSCTSRLVLWSNVVQLISQKPWAGWGWGELDYAHYTTLYSSERFCDILDNAHNLPLHLAVELGIPLSLLVCGGVAWLVLRARPWAETNPTRQMAWGVLALIVLHSLLEYPLWYGPFQMAFGLCVYLLWATKTRRVRAERLATVPGAAAVSRKHLQLALAAALLIAVAYAAWDYHRVSQIYLAPSQRASAYREDALEKTRDTWLFRQQFNFAMLSLTPLTRENALQVYTLGNQLLHFSPEPRVIEKVIESAVMLGRDEDALLHLARYRAAFPESHAGWRRGVLSRDATE